MELLEHQKKAVKFIKERKKVLLADDMGLGKTATSIVAAEEGGSAPYLVICPATLVKNWERELQMWSKNPKRWQVYSYEKSTKYFREYKVYKSVIVDEAHNLGAKSQRYRTAKLFCDEASFVLCLTGTPLRNTAKDVYPIARMLGKAKDEKAFMEKHYNKIRNGYGVQYTTPKKSLKELLNSFMLRRTKDTADISLPEKKVHVKEILNSATPKGHSFKSQSEYEKYSFQRKLEESVRFINRLLEKDSVVVFVHHKQSIDKLLRYFPDAAVVNGSQTKAKKQENVDAFQSGEKKIIICSLMACSTGITLTKSSTLVFMEFSWTPAVLAQAEDRVHRIGQTKTCNIYYLVAKNSAEEKKLLTAQLKEIENRLIIGK